MSVISALTKTSPAELWMQEQIAKISVPPYRMQFCYFERVDR